MKSNLTGAKQNTLLIVDDMEVNRAILRGLFEQEYNLLEAENGAQALVLIKQYQDVLAGVLLDLLMPVKDGYEVMKDMAREGLMASIPVIVITAEDSMENEVKAFDMGAADIIMKPFEPLVVRRRVQNAVELNRHKTHLEEMVQEQATKLKHSREVIMDTLSSIIEHRSVETGQHVLRIRMFTKILLEEVMHCCPEYELNERAISVIAEASALHDIGKIAIPDTILNKPGRLTKEEFEIMKTHTLQGCEILSGLGRMGDEEYLRYAYNICRYHHERWDGKGYPDGLVGDNTPVYAQAVGVADAYDALTTDRVYKKAIAPEKAMQMILNGECGTFSPKLLECMKNVKEQFYRLAREYADGLSPHTDFERESPQPVPKNSVVENVTELAQMKYLTLLRYLEATVMEVDLDSGLHHLVYQQGEDFEELRSGGSFEEIMDNFMEHSVNPEDRKGLLELGQYISDFFDRGLLRQNRYYRVLHRATGDYAWYEAAILRVEMENPMRHKMLLIWKKMKENKDGAGQAGLHMQQMGKVVQEDAGEIVCEQVCSESGGIMIGVLRCRYDEYLTLTGVNTGFVSMLGYGREELREKFHNSFLAMIHTEDRGMVRRRFLEQIMSGGSQEMEYRVTAKDGHNVWVLGRCQSFLGEDGREYLNCVLTDITQLRQAGEEMRLEVERYRLIQEQTGDIIFEVRLKTGEMRVSTNFERKFGYKPISDNILTRLQTESHLLPEDIPVFTRMLEDIFEGAAYRECEIRLANAEGKYRWCRVRLSSQYSEAGEPINAVGVLIDINDEKSRSEALAERADQDAFTRLYNKEATQKRIKNRLERRGSQEGYAMFLIDLDNFKQINDACGHLFGDAVLAEATKRLKALSKARDIVGRYGGDEFLIFVEGLGSVQDLERKAARILESLQGVYEDRLQGFRLGCSIGIARCPEDGTEYGELFEHCDRALYHAKKQGKNQAAIYDADLMKRVFGMDEGNFLAAGTKIEPAAPHDYSIVPRAFQKLYESGRVEEAVNGILEMVGRRYKVSRVYIMENEEAEGWMQNTFEWCSEGIQPELGQRQEISYERLGIKERFNERGIFYCGEVSGLPKEEQELLASKGVRSVLQCAIRDSGSFAGLVGFEDCGRERLWTQDQIDTLTFISEFLSMFLLKKRAQDRAVTAAKDLQGLLDSLNSWIYVIDPESWRLLYVNAKTSQDFPGVKAGMRCHEAFFRQGEPCQRCPAKECGAEGRTVVEADSPVFKICVGVEASRIKWEGKEALLMVCSPE